MIPIEIDGNHILLFKRRIETPAPKASILVAIARLTIQKVEIQFIFSFSSFKNASNINFNAKRKNTKKTII